jgi:superkiller protein 3
MSFALQSVVVSTATLHQQGVEKFKAHEYSAAIAALQEAAQSEKEGTPAFKESMVMIGQSYFMLSQAPKAIPFLEKVAGLTDADYMLGYAYIENRQPELSEAAFARLFHLDPKSAPGHLLGGQMLLKKGFEAEAQLELQKALALQPNLPETNFLLAEIAIFQGRLPDGVLYLQKEISLNPNFSMAWYRLGDAYLRQQQWDSAVPQLQRAIWLNPDFSGPYILLGKCYFKQKNYSNAEGILRKGLQLDPQNASGTYLLGQTLMAEGKSDEAHTEMEKVKSLHAE